MDLNAKIKTQGGVYKRYAPLLEKLEIINFSDFLYHIPSHFDDFTNIKKIKDLQIGEITTLIGTIETVKNVYTKSYKKIQQVVITDETGKLELVWFNQPFILNVIKKGDKISVAGRIEKTGNFKIVSPEYEILFNEQTNLIHTGRLVPVYPLTQGLTSKWIRRQTYKLIHENLENLNDYLPILILNEQNLMPLTSAFEQLHFPKTLSDFNKAKERLAFDEIFILDLLSKQRKQLWNKNKTNLKINYEKYKDKIEDFIKNLPFELTNSQKTAINDMFSDFKNLKSMNRLLLGDVGSGKTIVAAILMYLAHLNGYKSAFMAPTEILATQHFKTISNLLIPLGLKIGIQTGSQKTFNQNNTINIIIGTHALLSDKLNIPNLGLAIVDEQHRFGVEQRTILRKKGDNIHFLAMSATPIPRTVVLTAYGDLDVSYLSDMPKGRKVIKTWLVPNNKREGAYKWIEKQIKKGDQAFIVCPFIEESESMTTVKAAKKEFERLQKEIFPNLKLAMLHGKIKAKEKDKILSDFKDKKYDILVATPVVEVGIDIPNATIILIEAAERFGLAQLHQLRGRVGRGEKQSYCLLFSESNNIQTRERLKKMENISSGIELAELDLHLRGGGDIYGTLQSGSKLLKIASFSDFELISKAKNAANKIWPEIKKYPELLKKLEENSHDIMPD